MARQAEAERERRAKVIGAEGEFQAAEKLVEAAKMMGRRMKKYTEESILAFIRRRNFNREEIERVYFQYKNPMSHIGITLPNPISISSFRT